MIQSRSRSIPVVVALAHFDPVLSWYNVSNGYIEIKHPLKLLVSCQWELTIFMTLHHTLSLTHWGRDQIDSISQTSFSNAFSRMKMDGFRLGFHWSLFLRFELIIQHWFRQWLGADQATSHYLNQWWLVYWHIYASLGLNELTLLPEWNFL